MVVQLSLNFGEIMAEERKSPEIAMPKRVRYLVPTYIKFYTIYQYDRKKFTKLLKIWLKTNEGKKRTLETLKAKQEEILKLCYLKDAEGNLLKDSDEKHIFRYKTLENIYEAIYNQLGVNPFITDDFEEDGLFISPDEQQAEIINTWELPIKIRVIIHIRLLRLLRKGFTIKEALCRLNGLLKSETLKN